jgi:hypothetical protein
MSEEMIAPDTPAEFHPRWSSGFAIAVSLLCFPLSMLGLGIAIHNARKWKWERGMPGVVVCAGLCLLHFALILMVAAS